MNKKIKTINVFFFLYFVLFSSLSIATTTDTKDKIKSIWNFNTDTFSQPCVFANDTVYFIANTYPNKLYAVTKEGKEKWHLALPYQRYSTPIIDKKGFIYILGRDLTLYSIYPSGQIKWQIQIPHNSHESGNVSIPLTMGKWSQRIYVTSSEGKIFAVNTDGITSWQYTPRFISSIDTPVIEHGDKINPLIYFVLNRDYLKPTQYTEIHQVKQQTDSIIKLGPANIYYLDISASGKIYYIYRKNYASTIEILDPNGKTLWNTRSNGSSVIAVLDKDGTLYYVGVDQNKQYVAARNHQGKLLWINNYPNLISDIVLMNDKLVIFYNTQFNPAREKMIVFAKNDGYYLCSSLELDFLFAYPHASDDFIYLATNNGVSAFKLPELETHKEICSRFFSLEHNS